MLFNECRYCDDGACQSEPEPYAFYNEVCPDCIYSFERDDAPEELAITLGDVSVDDACRYCGFCPCHCLWLALGGDCIDPRDSQFR